MVPYAFKRHGEDKILEDTSQEIGTTSSHLVTNSLDIGIASFFITLGLVAIVEAIVDEIVSRPKPKPQAKPQPQPQSYPVWKSVEIHDDDHIAEHTLLVVLIIGVILLFLIYIFMMGMWGMNEQVLQSKP